MEGFAKKCIIGCIILGIAVIVIVTIMDQIVPLIR